MVTKPCSSIFDDVAGVVPAIGRGFDHTGIVGAQVTQHDIGAFDEQPAAFGDAFDRLEPVFDAVEQPADGAGAVMHRRVDGKNRRAFGGAIAFENAQPEFFHPEFAGFRLHPLGPGHDQAHVEEIIGIGVAGIAHEKRIGAKQHGGVGVVGKLGDRSCSAAARDRGRCARPASTGSRVPRGQAKGVEHGQALNTMSWAVKAMRAAA